MINIQTVLSAYITAALWSSYDENGDPLDGDYSAHDISESAKLDMLQDVTAFVTSYARLLMQSGLGADQIGHDFWLTRNGHGAGFWDRGLGAVGDSLSEAAKIGGSIDLYIGHDGRIYY